MTQWRPPQLWHFAWRRVLLYHAFSTVLLLQSLDRGAPEMESFWQRSGRHRRIRDVQLRKWLHTCWPQFPCRLGWRHFRAGVHQLPGSPCCWRPSVLRKDYAQPHRDHHFPETAVCQLGLPVEEVSGLHCSVTGTWGFSASFRDTFPAMASTRRGSPNRAVLALALKESDVRWPTNRSNPRDGTD